MSDIWRLAFRVWVRSLGFDPDTLKDRSPSLREALKANFEDSVKAGRIQF